MYRADGSSGACRDYCLGQGVTSGLVRFQSGGGICRCAVDAKVNGGGLGFWAMGKHDRAVGPGGSSCFERQYTEIKKEMNTD
jgi:hypothetical protein